MSFQCEREGSCLGCSDCVAEMNVSLTDANLILGLLSDVPWSCASVSMRSETRMLLLRLRRLPFGTKFKKRVRALVTLIEDTTPSSDDAAAAPLKWAVGDRVVMEQGDEVDHGTIRVVHSGSKMVSVKWDVSMREPRVWTRKLKPHLCNEGGCGEPLRECPSGLVCKNGHGR